MYGGAWGGGVQGVSPHFSQFSFCLIFFSVSSRRRRRRGLHTAISNKACAQTSKQASQPYIEFVHPCARLVPSVGWIFTKMKLRFCTEIEYPSVRRIPIEYFSITSVI